MKMSRTCENCIYWTRLAADIGEPAYVGTCRRYAPRPHMKTIRSKPEPEWPQTVDDDWCGEHSCCPKPTTRNGWRLDEQGREIHT